MGQKKRTSYGLSCLVSWSHNLLQNRSLCMAGRCFEELLPVTACRWWSFYAAVCHHWVTRLCACQVRRPSTMTQTRQQLRLMPFFVEGSEFECLICQAIVGQVIQELRMACCPGVAVQHCDHQSGSRRVHVVAGECCCVLKNGQGSEQLLGSADVMHAGAGQMVDVEEGAVEALRTGLQCSHLAADTVFSQVKALTGVASAATHTQKWCLCVHACVSMCVCASDSRSASHQKVQASRIDVDTDKSVVTTGTTCRLA